MKKILVPTDFSAEAHNAVIYASNLAKASQAQLILIHVKDEPEVRSAAEAGQATDHDYVLKVFKNLKHSLEESGFDNVTYVMREGNLTMELSDFVQREAIDLVVMGTRPYHDLIEQISGSNTYELVEEGVCPVLVVPEGALFYAPEKILFAIDYEPIQNSATLNPLKELALRFGAKLDVVHVQEAIAKDKKEKKVVEELKKQMAPTTDIAFHVVLEDDIAHALHYYIEEHTPEILILISKKRGFIEGLLHYSIVKEMVHAPQIPILILPELDKDMKNRDKKSKYVF
jgi:nucleotide-binding universal stress UspA family protein